MCALELSDAGLQVSVLDQEPRIGGAASTDRLECGCSLPTGANVAPLVDKSLLERVGLDPASLFLESRPLLASVAGETFSVPARSDQLVQWSEINFEAGDATERFLSDVGATAAAVMPLWSDPFATEERFRAAAVAAIGPQGARFVDGSLLELARAYFPDSASLRVLLVGIQNLLQAPLSEPGSAFSVLYLAGGNCESAGDGVVRGGLRTITDALYEACLEAGVQFRLSAQASAFELADNRVVAVSLTDGESIGGDVFVCGFSPRSMVKMCESRRIPDIDEAPYGTGCVKINGLAPRAVLESHLGFLQTGAIQSVHCASEDRMVELGRTAAAGEAGAACLIEVVATSLADGTSSCADHSAVSIYGLYYPYALDQPSTSAARDWLLDQLAEVNEELSKSIEVVSVASPGRLESRWGMLRGDVDHGSLAVGNRAERRGSGLLPHGSTAIPNLFNCSSGIHPGGLVTGRPGRIAAMAVLEGLANAT